MEMDWGLEIEEISGAKTIKVEIKIPVEDIYNIVIKSNEFDNWIDNIPSVLATLKAKEMTSEFNILTNQMEGYRYGKNRYDD